MPFQEKDSPDHVSLARNLVSSLQKKSFPSRRHFAYLMHMLSPRELLVVRSLALVMLTSLVVLNVYLYQTSTHMVPSQGGTLREGMVGNAHSFNPILATEKVDLEISSLIFSSLFKYDPVQETFVPDLVDHMEVSSDEKTYTLTLRKNITWHDAEPFDADDVLFTLEIAMDPAYKSPLGASLKGMKVKKQDQYTIILTLETPYAFLPSVLTFGIIPAHVFQQINPAAFPLSEANLNPVGTGPFAFERIRKDTQGAIRSIELKGNTRFLLTAPVYIENLIIKLFPTRAELVAALQEKSIDAAGMLPDADEPLPLALREHFHAFSLAFPQYTGLFLNEQKNQWLRYKEVRQALLLALPKQSMAQELYGSDVEIIDTPLLPFVKTLQGLPNGNILEAKKILQAWQEGMKPKPTKTKAKKSTPPPLAPSPSLTLTASSNPGQIAIAEKIAASWTALGIPTTVKTVESSKIKREIVRTRDYEVLLFSLKTDGTQDPYIFWHSSQREWPGLNLGLFSDTEADTLMTQARATYNETAQKEKYQALATIINKQIPAIMLWRSHYLYLIAPSFSGVTLKGLSATQDRFAHIAEWYTKEKRSW